MASVKLNKDVFNNFREKLFPESETIANEIKLTKGNSTNYQVYCQSVRIFCGKNLKNYPQIKLSSTKLSELWKIVKLDHEQLFRDLAKERNNGCYDTKIEVVIDHKPYLQRIFNLTS